MNNQNLPGTICRLLSHAYSRQAIHCRIPQLRRHYGVVDKPLSRAEDVAIIGGGITGMTTAYRIAQLSPNSKVTVYEASSREGGWIRSTYVDIGNGEKVLFEAGPRSLRPAGMNAMVTKVLLNECGLGPEVVIASPDSPSALNRFIHDGTSLQKLPSGPRELLKRIFSLHLSSMADTTTRDIPEAIFHDFWQPARNEDIVDESLESFLMRRGGSTELCDVASAGVHGIYAGDISQLSAPSLFKYGYDLEEQWGGIVRSLLAKAIFEIIPPGSQIPRFLIKWLTPIKEKEKDRMFLREAELGKEMESYDFSKPGFVQLKRSDTSIYSFREGMESLVRALGDKLKTLPNVTILTNSRTKTIKRAASGQGVDLWLENDEKPRHHSLAAVTLSKSQLQDIVSIDVPSPETADLGTDYSVSVGVVNVCFPRTEKPLHPPGFGYLLPRNVPFFSNPERALGVIFDSTALQGQDHLDPSIPGTPTKLTVMMGGHWWDGMQELPDPEELKVMALSVLHRHLGINLKPLAMEASLNRNCIYQYTVGHGRRMANLNTALMRGFGGRLRVAGSAYTGVGVNDCARAGWCLAEDIVLQETCANNEVLTGLEQFAEFKGTYIT